MKVTYDIPRATKNALEDIKMRLRRRGLSAFERSILVFLIDHADPNAIERHFRQKIRGR